MENGHGLPLNNFYLYLIINKWSLVFGYSIENPF